MSLRERAETLVQMAEIARYRSEDFDEIDAKATKKNPRSVILEPLRSVRDQLSELPAWEHSEIANTIEMNAPEFELNLGKLGQPLRVAVTGGPVAPPIDVTLWLVSREQTL